MESLWNLNRDLHSEITVVQSEITPVSTNKWCGSVVGMGGGGGGYSPKIYKNM